MASGRIFINYRRDDSRADAGRLYDRLNARFPNRVFRDVSALEPGVEWDIAIDKALGACDACIVVIGQSWLSIADAQGRRRLDNPDDTVRREIATALKQKMRVIPALVGGASMPGPEDLPEELRPLTKRNALQFTEQDWEHDVDLLIQALERALGGSESESQPERSRQGEESSTPYARAQQAISRQDWAAAVLALRECMALNPNDASSAAQLRWALEQQQRVPGGAGGEQRLSGLQPEPVYSPPPQPVLNAAAVVGRWQLKEIQAIMQIAGIMDLYPNFQFQVLVQGMAVMAGLWGFNPMSGSIELQGQNLYGMGFRGSLRAQGESSQVFSGVCVDAIGNSWTWELRR
ncbi:MAG TPA: toll/interleukin-1 receptor domain-containing protein [Terriglobia bacterium]|jgi:hypothetical protein|nr:toll/interleukin-1 receptor domain-containing protein [Terriglobia bacterium]